MANAPRRIIAFPKSGHPYTEGFYRAVEAEGIPVVEGDFSGRWLLRNVGRHDVVHLHWPSHAYESNQGIGSLVRRFTRWVGLIVLCRLLGARIVWTAHNLLPHKRSAAPVVDVLARRLLTVLAEIILVHGPSAASELVARFPGTKDKIVLIPLGNWIDYYPVTHTRASARAELGIPESTFAFLFFGLCAPYKNLDGLIGAFRHLGGQVALVIAGRFQDPSYEEQIRSLARGDERIRIHAGFVADAEVHTYLIASDAVVVPYREVLTSGTAMLALSFGRPILSVSHGFLIDVVNPEVGWLFKSTEEDGLRRALEDMPRRRYDERTILDHARRYRHEDAARNFLAALEGRDDHRGPDAPESPRQPRR